MMFAAGLAACAVALVLALVRAMRGPTAFDRLLSVNAIGTTVILGIALHGYVMGRPEFVDISILYAIINFIGTFAVLKLFDTLLEKAAGLAPRVRKRPGTRQQKRSDKYNRKKFLHEDLRQAKIQLE